MGLCCLWYEIRFRFWIWFWSWLTYFWPMPPIDPKRLTGRAEQEENGDCLLGANQSTPDPRLEEKRLFDDLAVLAADPRPAEADGEG